MDYDRIKYAVYNIYDTCEIYSLPFDCISALSQLGYRCTKYSSLSAEGYDACLKLSDDAYIIDKEIFYNDNKPNRRIRFSLMHELGHLVLNTHDESAANTFASNILAPSMAVYFSRLKNIRDISNIFNISLECARYALETCDKWVYSAKHYGMTEIDKKIYNHFYDEDVNGFVFKKAPCAFCDDILINSNKPVCKKCDKPLYGPLLSGNNDSLMIAESNWLYGGL